MQDFDRSQSWSPAPGMLNLEPGWAHIFRLNLVYQGTISDALWQDLTSEEKNRASRFRKPADREIFAYAHFFLHQILATYLRCLPGSLQFTTGKFGKPAITPTTSLRFNLTHSAGVGLLAVSAGQEIGIDVERHRPHLDRDAIARRFFSPREVEAIAVLAPEQQENAFFACWTRKEAYIKARGGGLFIPLDSFRVSVIPGAPVVLFDPADATEASSNWTIIEIFPGNGFHAALAIEGSLAGVRCWNWPG